MPVYKNIYCVETIKQVFKGRYVRKRSHIIKNTEVQYERAIKTTNWNLFIFKVNSLFEDNTLMYQGCINKLDLCFKIVNCPSDILNKH